jgi:hypothetical protein
MHRPAQTAAVRLPRLQRYPLLLRSSWAWQPRLKSFSASRLAPMPPFPVSLQPMHRCAHSPCYRSPYANTPLTVPGRLLDHVRKGALGQSDAFHIGDRLFREVSQDVAGWGFDAKGTTQLL